MKVTIEINCDNDAFQPYEAHETARILERLAERMRELHDVDVTLPFDENGNRVGAVTVTE